MILTYLRLSNRRSPEKLLRRKKRRGRRLRRQEDQRNDDSKKIESRKVTSSRQSNSTESSLSENKGTDGESGEEEDSENEDKMDGHRRVSEGENEYTDHTNSDKKENDEEGEEDEEEDDDDESEEEDEESDDTKNDKESSSKDVETSGESKLGHSKENSFSSSEDFKVDFPDPPSSWDSFEDFKFPFDDKVDFDLDKFLADLKKDKFDDFKIFENGRNHSVSTTVYPTSIFNFGSTAFPLIETSTVPAPIRFNFYFPNFKKNVTNQGRIKNDGKELSEESRHASENKLSPRTDLGVSWESTRVPSSTTPSPIDQRKGTKPNKFGKIRRTSLSPAITHPAVDRIGNVDPQSQIQASLKLNNRTRGYVTAGNKLSEGDNNLAFTQPPKSRGTAKFTFHTSRMGERTTPKYVSDKNLPEGAPSPTENLQRLNVLSEQDKITSTHGVQSTKPTVFENKYDNYKLSSSPDNNRRHVKLRTQGKNVESTSSSENLSSSLDNTSFLRRSTEGIRSPPIPPTFASINEQNDHRVVSYSYPSVTFHESRGPLSKDTGTGSRVEGNNRKPIYAIRVPQSVSRRSKAMYPQGSQKSPTDRPFSQQGQRMHSQRQRGSPPSRHKFTPQSNQQRGRLMGNNYQNRQHQHNLGPSRRTPPKNYPNGNNFYRIKPLNTRYYFSPNRNQQNATKEETIDNYKDYDEQSGETHDQHENNDKRQNFKSVNREPHYFSYNDHTNYHNTTSDDSEETIGENGERTHEYDNKTSENEKYRRNEYKLNNGNLLSNHRVPGSDSHFKHSPNSSVYVNNRLHSFSYVNFHGNDQSTTEKNSVEIELRTTNPPTFNTQLFGGFKPSLGLTSIPVLTPKYNKGNAQGNTLEVVPIQKPTNETQKTNSPGGSYVYFSSNIGSTVAVPVHKNNLYENHKSGPDDTYNDYYNDYDEEDYEDAGNKTLTPPKPPPVPKTLQDLENQDYDDEDYDEYDDEGYDDDRSSEEKDKNNGSKDEEYYDDEESEEEEEPKREESIERPKAAMTGSSTTTQAVGCIPPGVTPQPGNEANLCQRETPTDKPIPTTKSDEQNNSEQTKRTITLLR